MRLFMNYTNYTLTYILTLTLLVACGSSESPQEQVGQALSELKSFGLTHLPDDSSIVRFFNVDFEANTISASTYDPTIFFLSFGRHSRCGVKADLPDDFRKQLKGSLRNLVFAENYSDPEELEKKLEAYRRISIEDADKRKLILVLDAKDAKFERPVVDGKCKLLSVLLQLTQSLPDMECPELFADSMQCDLL